MKTINLKDLELEKKELEFLYKCVVNNTNTNKFIDCLIETSKESINNNTFNDVFVIDVDNKNLDKGLLLYLDKNDFYIKFNCILDDNMSFSYDESINIVFINNFKKTLDKYKIIIKEKYVDETILIIVSYLNIIWNKQLYKYDEICTDKFILKRIDDNSYRIEEK